MLSLIKIEWLKIKKYKAFWWMLVVVILTYPGINAIFVNVYKEIAGNKDMLGQLAKMLLGNPYAFPEAWHTVAFFSSLFIAIPSILVIMLITNEYNYKTHRQNIIDGWSRNQFVTSKLIDVSIVSLITTAAYILVAIGYALYIDANSMSRAYEQLKYIPLFLLQSFSQLSIAFLLGFFIRKAFIALGIFLFYYLVVENILVSLDLWKKIGYSDFLPFQVSDKLIPPPAFFGRFGKDAADAYQKAIDAIPYHIVYTLILTATIWFICYRANNKRDL